MSKDYEELLKTRAYVDLYVRVYSDLNGVKPEVGALQRQALRRTFDLIEKHLSEK